LTLDSADAGIRTEIERQLEEGISEPSIYDEFVERGQAAGKSVPDTPTPSLVGIQPDEGTPQPKKRSTLRERLKAARASRPDPFEGIEAPDEGE